MKPEDRILELLKEKPMLMTELQEELRFTTNGIVGVMAFLENYKLVETSVSTEHELMAKITPRGLQLLNSPDLPEEESPSNLLELMERHYGGKIGVELKTLYTPTQHAETTDWITDMAIRYGVKANDIICAMWFIAKDMVWAKLEQDVKASHSFFAVTPPLVSAKTGRDKQ